MDDVRQQKITTAAEYMDALFRLYDIKLQQANKRLAQRKARDRATEKIFALYRIQARLNKGGGNYGR